MAVGDLAKETKHPLSSPGLYCNINGQSRMYVVVQEVFPLEHEENSPKASPGIELEPDFHQDVD